MFCDEPLSLRMKKALQADKFVIIEPKFQVVPDSHRPNILNLREAKGLDAIFSVAAAKWQQDHHHDYTEFEAGSAARIAELLSAFRRAGHSLGLKGEDLSSRLKIRMYRTLAPWGSFFPETLTKLSTTKSNRSKNTLHITDVFHALYSNAERQPARSRIPALIPMMRHNISISVEDTRRSRYKAHLLTGQSWTARLESQDIKIQDIIRVPDRELRHKMVMADQFSMIAIPFLERWNLASVIKDSKPYPVCLFWHICDDRQVVFQEQLSNRQNINRASNRDVGFTSPGPTTPVQLSLF
jgi:hypothetical protein